MIKYILKRLLYMIPVILCVAILIFTIMFFCPGDPARSVLGSEATEVDIAQMREDMGLNDPFLVQLGRFLYELILKGDIGDSYISGLPVWDEIVIRLPRTLIFAISVLVIEFVVGTPLGVSAAIHQNGWGDRICMLVALLGVSIPGFWLAMELVILFALKLRWLPAYGMDSVACWILPVICNSFGGIAMQARQTRSGMLECIRSDYVTTARAKGLPERTILYKYALPNAMIPLIQTMGDGFASALAGTVILENVFSIQGMGTYLTQGITQRDYPVVRGCVVVLAIAFSIVMLLVDLAFAFVDPRIKARYERQSTRRDVGRRQKANA